MKAAVIYDSTTGNTEEIAATIRKTLEDMALKENGQKIEMVYYGAPDDEIKADLYFVGSWTDKGMCSEKICNYLKCLKNTKIAYFGTAGFGGSEAYFKQLFDRIRENLDESNQICEPFFCQGKMPMGVRARYEKMLAQEPENARMQQAIENFDRALSHPDDADRESTEKWVGNVLKEKK